MSSMAYIPTEEELTMLGFQDIISFSDGTTLGRYYIKNPMQLPYIEYNPGYGRWFIFDRNNTIPLYPQSISDIGTLIRLFTNN